MKRILRKILLCMILGCALFLTACAGGAAGEPEMGQAGGPVILKLAVFGQNAKVSAQVAAFNESHTDYQIVVEQYSRSDVPEEDGIARLQREIMTGDGPDLIDFGSGYATSDIVGGYTEDLLPYLRADMEAAGAGDGKVYFDNILSAFCYNGALYALPTSFTLQTFAGSRAVLGDREGWNIREMMECYGNRREGVILYPGEMKKDVFGQIMYGSLDYYIDWEQGSCRFDSGEFADVLAFAGMFPDTLRISEDQSVKQIFADGGALLCPLKLQEIYDICSAEYIFGAEDITYIGFPVEEGRGTLISPSDVMLAISVNSGHKDAAWEFVSGFLDEEYQAGITWGFPILRSALEQKLEDGREIEYTQDAEGKQVPVSKAQIRFEGEEPEEVYHVTKAQADSLLQLIETASICSAGDQGLYGILLEEAGGYFAGDKDLEETCRLIQGRASLYVSERVR